ncbi:MAG: response regulator [Gemmatimonadetes bacterium]|nr:response regulator [Gemmatimonadota bacterium]
MTEPVMSPPPLVLIANDQEWSARSLESILAPNGYAVLRAYTGQQALDRARSARPDLVILDAQMPDLHGFEVCRQLRADPRFNATTPIIITTAGPSGRAQRLDAYRAGAWEFLGQPLDGESLLLKLATFLASKLESDRLREESFLDQLTGLYNMRGLSRRAREIGAEVSRRHQPLACIVFAPEAGDTQVEDQALERIGQVLRAQGRSSDAFGRLGDGEFAVVAPDTPSIGAVRMFERLEAPAGPRQRERRRPAPAAGRLLRRSELRRVQGRRGGDAAAGHLGPPPAAGRRRRRADPGLRPGPRARRGLTPAAYSPPLVPALDWAATCGGACSSSDE